MKKLSRDQAAVIGAYTGILCGPVEDLQVYAQKALGTPVFSHQFGSPEFVEHLKSAVKSDFIALCASREDAQ